MRPFRGLLLALACVVGLGAEELVNCRLLDRPGLHRVRLGEGRILSIDAPSRDRHRLDCRGGYLLPGFIDAHVHLGLSSPAAVVQGGVTTVRDLGWEPSRVLGWARQDLGLHLLWVGPILTGPGSYPLGAGWAPHGTGLELATPAEAEAVVDRLVSQGAHSLKVALQPGRRATMSRPVLSALVRRAHHHRRKVVAHVGSLSELDKAIECGVDELAHLLFADETIPDDRLQRMRARNMACCPTLHISPTPRRVDNLRRWVKLGGRVIYGTDLGNAGPPPGIDLEELEWMSQAGMTPGQIVYSATAGAADWLGLNDRGRIRPGAQADLILVRGDPLRDLKVLGRLERVWFQASSRRTTSTGR